MARMLPMKVGLNINKNKYLKISIMIFGYFTCHSGQVKELMDCFSMVFMNEFTMFTNIFWRLVARNIHLCELTPNSLENIVFD